jgi:hypothetical protein
VERSKGDGVRYRWHHMEEGGSEPRPMGGREEPRAGGRGWHGAEEEARLTPQATATVLAV